MKKRTLAALLALCLLLALTACGEKPAPAPAEEPAPAEQTEPTAPEEPAKPEEPEEPVPAGTNPLTGLPMEPEYENDRPVAVMLNNLKAAMPQLGVSRADIIYEVPAEGGITRMLALFQTLDGVETLGSIRSTRPYYIELALGHDALLVHAGGSPEAYQDIKSWGVANMDGVNGGSDAKIFWRDAQRRKSAGYEHSMLTSGANIADYLSGGRYRTEHRDGYTYPVTFAEDGTPRLGTDANKITLRFSEYKTGVFTYDAETGRYLVSQYGTAYIDGNTGEQVGVTNVLILETDVATLDSVGRLRVRTTGEGVGTYFCGGKSAPIRWSRADRDSPLTYTAQDGAPLSLGRGTTYVCLISPKRSTVTVE